ncbi:hypothetical protein BaRGS_00001125 [Batillaria attramentaria]|uniref:Uncharacterized protein n=1 Tax=Batillaria attramentaria TaxID=370345 RepID=A0ABD0M619_9CAEN
MEGRSIQTAGVDLMRVFTELHGYRKEAAAAGEQLFVHAMRVVFPFHHRMESLKAGKFCKYGLQSVIRQKNRQAKKKNTCSVLTVRPRILFRDVTEYLRFDCVDSGQTKQIVPNPLLTFLYQRCCQLTFNVRKTHAADRLSNGMMNWILSAAKYYTALHVSEH